AGGGLLGCVRPPPFRAGGARGFTRAALSQVLGSTQFPSAGARGFSRAALSQVLAQHSSRPKEREASAERHRRRRAFCLGPRRGARRAELRSFLGAFAPRLSATSCVGW